MPTFSTEVRNKRADGTYNVKIRVIHNRVPQRISTPLFIGKDNLTRSLKIKDEYILNICADYIRKCKKYCEELGFQINNISCLELKGLLEKHLLNESTPEDGNFQLDFIEYCIKKTSTMKKATGEDYLRMVAALKRFINREKLDIFEINKSFLTQFEKFLQNEPCQRGHNRKTPVTEEKPKGKRAVSKYLGSLRAMYNFAKQDYNDEDLGIIKIPFSPFKSYKVQKQPKTRKRALTIEAIQKIIDLPDDPHLVPGHFNRYNMAKDCFLLSFGLIGMNAADLYRAKPPKNNILIYHRQKTEDSRDDDAEMWVKLEEYILGLIKKYKDPNGQRMFNFYLHYSTKDSFSSNLNIALKKVGAAIGVDDLEFYAARHSWATIARSAKVGIDKYTIHEALNHAPDYKMKVTDIYIDKDWQVIWNANKKVLALFDWSNL